MKTRTYGNKGTIHQTEQLDVEVDKHGNVVAVWFRCQLLPFKQADVNSNRAREMNRAYADDLGIPGLVAVELVDKESTGE